MYIRCSQCKDSMRVPPTCYGRQVSCTTCGHVHGLSRTRELGEMPVDRFKRALAYSEQQGIDLASAYSVLLGIMSREEVADVGSGLEDDPDPPSAASRKIAYDRGFADAVSEGFLTVRQAVERGDRVNYASRLARQHGLTMNKAFLVADNRLKLADALAKPGPARRTRRQPAALRTGDTPRENRTLSHALAVVLIALVAGAWANAYQDRAAAEDAAPAARPAEPEPSDVIRFAASRPSIEKDSLGRVTRVEGSHPRTVLGTFCESDPIYTRSPVRLSPRGPGWIGVFEDRGALYGIEIREDSESGVWYAGNGLTWIRPLRISTRSGARRLASPAPLRAAGR